MGSQHHSRAIVVQSSKSRAASHLEVPKDFNLQAIPLSVVTFISVHFRHKGYEDVFSGLILLWCERPDFIKGHERTTAVGDLDWGKEYCFICGSPTYPPNGAILLSFI